MFYYKNEKQMAYLDSLIWLQINRDIPSSQSYWFFRNYRRYNRTCQDYSHTDDLFLQKYKCQAEKIKNKSAITSLLELDTVH